MDLLHEGGAPAAINPASVPVLPVHRRCKLCVHAGSHISSAETAHRALVCMSSVSWQQMVTFLHACCGCQAELFRLEGLFHVALGDGDAADRAFSTALTLWPQLAAAWLSWGEFCDSKVLGRKVPIASCRGSLGSCSDTSVWLWKLGPYQMCVFKTFRSPVCLPFMHFEPCKAGGASAVPRCALQPSPSRVKAGAKAFRDWRYWCIVCDIRRS